jgi:hypothetical protein
MYSIVDQKIYGIVDAVTPDLVKVLRNEILENVT